MGINLKAYRFSESELKKLIELSQLFLGNNLVTDRFPEVYYDDIDNYEYLFGKIKATNEDTPDYLGVYHYNCESDELTTKEGIIVLFKDRIENFCKRKSVGLSEVRYIVLMHELGHWLTHWSEFDRENWKKGFGIDNPMTYESLAQLIAFWAVDGNPVCEEILRDKLTPKNKKDVYALYLELIVHSKSTILKKLVEIRKHYFLSDFFLHRFLNEDYKTLPDFISDLFLEKKYREMNVLEIEQKEIKILSDTCTYEKAVLDKYLEKRKDCDKIFIINPEDEMFKVFLDKVFFNKDFILKFHEILFKRRGSENGKKFGL